VAVQLLVDYVARLFGSIPTLVADADAVQHRSGCDAALFFFPLVRILAWLSFDPLLGNRTVPMRMRVVLGFVLTLAIAPILPSAPQVALVSGEGLLTLLQQIAIGAVLGISLRIVFAIVEVPGASWVCRWASRSPPCSIRSTGRRPGDLAIPGAHHDTRPVRLQRPPPGHRRPGAEFRRRADRNHPRRAGFRAVVHWVASCFPPASIWPCR